MNKLIGLTALVLLGTNIIIAAGPTDPELLKERINILKELVPSDHPRLMIKQAELNDFRAFITNNATNQQIQRPLKNAQRFSLAEPLIPEPEAPQGPNNYERRQVWRNGYSTAFKAASAAQQYAFTYLVTGDPAYGREAARWLIHLSRWDLEGGINIKDNDEAFIQSLRPMIFAYDWAYEALTPQERKQVLNHFQARLKILYTRITKHFYLAKPVTPNNSLSHPMRFISTLGLAGLVLYQDLPEAPTYLAWAYEYYLRQFPIWGGPAGGWSEGLNYWSTGTSQHLLFLEAMRTLGLTEIQNKPFFRNNGYFAMYNLLPYRASSFGDLCNTISPSSSIALIIEKYAQFYQDPYLQRYFELLHSDYPYKLNYYEFSCFDTIFHLFRKGQTPVTAGNLGDLPRSRYFSDIGWVALHSEIGNKANDVMLGFKSSPYGSASHSFADQNSFVINAFGEPLAISSGYREWYDSEHHLGWTRSTLSKNGILFGGAGQAVKDPEATGTVTRFYTGPNFDLVSGDATQAYYNLKVAKALRHILFVNRSYFVIFDELKTDKPLSHQWLLHAKERMTLQPEEGAVLVHQNQANLWLKFLHPATTDLKIRQTDRFTVPVHSAYSNQMKNEWHLTVDAFKPEKSQEFLTYLYPYRGSLTTTPAIRKVTASRGYTLYSSIGNQQDLILLAREAEKEASSEYGSLKGIAGVISKDSSGLSWALFEGTLLKFTEYMVSSSSPVTIEGRLTENEHRLTITTDQPVELQMRLPFPVRSISGIDQTEWSFLTAESLLIIKLTESKTVTIHK